jgi:hypothetical protein
VISDHQKKEVFDTGIQLDYKTLISSSNFTQYKMAQQGKQMRVGAHKGFAYNSVKLVLLANGNRYEVDSNTFSQSGKALYPFKVLSCPNSDPFHTYLYL